MHKILFFVTGIGLGDAVREHAIMQELRKRKNVKIRIAAYNTSYDFFKNKFPTLEMRGFDITSPRFKFGFWNFMRKNVILPLTWNAQIKRLKEETKKFKPDLVVTDFEPLGALFARRTGTKFIEVFGVEPKSFGEFLEGRVGNIFERLQVRYLRRMYELGNKYGEAIIVSTLLKQNNFDKFRFVNPIVRKVKNKRKEKGIVVVLGGSSFGLALGNNLINILPKFDEKFLIFGWPRKTRVKNCLFFPPTENALDYIKNSSGIISLSGSSTISEALVFKKPLLSFPIPGHIEQAYNAWILKQRKLAMVEEISYANEEILEESVRQFIDKRGKLRKNIERANIKGNGAEQAAKIISDIL